MSRSRSAAEAARLALGAACLLALAGCAGTGVVPGATLYERLGGREGIEAITEAMLVRSADDPRIRDDFAEADIVHLHASLSEHLCSLTGGPCTYRGRGMKAAHAGLGITEADFNALVENLVDAMTAGGVPIGAQNELLAILAPMRGEVIRQ